VRYGIKINLNNGFGCLYSKSSGSKTDLNMIHRVKIKNIVKYSLYRWTQKHSLPI